MCIYCRINVIYLYNLDSHPHNAIKMNSNVSAIRSVPGRAQVNHCHACNEIETLPHVLGFCQKGELLRVNRHNKVRSQVANCFHSTNKYEVYDDIRCISSTGSTRIRIRIYSESLGLTTYITTIKLD